MRVADWITIGSFTVLAVLTGWYAYQTQKLSKESERAAAAAERSAASAERILQLEYLPIVWARVRGKSGGSRGYRIQIKGQNVGRGIAMRVRARLHPEGYGDTEWVGLGDLPPTSESTVAWLHTEDENIFNAVSEGMEGVSASYLDPLGRKYVSRGGPATGQVLQILDDGTEVVVYNSRD